MLRITLSHFLIAYALTILATRILLSFRPKHAPKIGGFQLHHYMYGVVLVALYALVPWPAILGIGLGLIADELPLFFVFKTWDWPEDHWRQYSKTAWGVAIISLAMYAIAYFIR
ncbi:MAG: hypothetical protein KGI73_04615 [Patescibacteria group bacterium]|nr:hypothetical protein [Patescibacteria group bacterium]